MQIASRPSLRRIIAIDRALRAGKKPTAGSLAKELEVHRRTVVRDIDFMRDSLGAPIPPCRGRTGYAYSEPGWRLPFFSFTEGELIALFVAERIVQQYQGTPFEADLTRAFQKIADQLQDEVTLNAADLDAAHSFRLTAPSLHDVDIFRRLVAAVRSRRRIRITYWTASRDDTTEREIDPLHLANVDGDWYLLAWCHRRRKVLTFAPSRIRKLNETEATFEPPADFAPEKTLSGGFRIIRDANGALHSVRLRFAPFSARYVRERTWHPSQVATESPDGGLELSLKLASLIEVRRWALSFGGDCEVLEPPELRQQIAEEARRLLASHATSGESDAAVRTAQAMVAPAALPAKASEISAAGAKPQPPLRPVTASAKPRRTRPKT